MLIDEIKSSYVDGILRAMDSLLYESAFPFEALKGISEEKQREVLEIARRLYSEKKDIKICRLCHHTELLVDDWMSSKLCVGCYNTRNNRKRADEILREGM